MSDSKKRDTSTREENVDIPDRKEQDTPMLQTEQEKPLRRRPTKNNLVIIVEDGYFILDSSKKKFLETNDLFEALGTLKKQPPGYELFRTSDGTKLAFNARQKNTEYILSSMSGRGFKK